MRRAVTAFLATVLAMIATGGAWAADAGGSAWADNEAGRVRLISAATAAGDAATLALGLHFELKPGWKIYWRSPGDAGYPPKIDWSGSDNLAEPEIRWPAPKRFVLAGLQNHGYANEIVLPMRADVPRPGAPIAVKAAVEYLACAEICVPMQADLTLSLPAGSGPPSQFAHLIGRFEAKIPGDGARHGLSLENVEALGEGDGTFLRVTVRSSQPLNRPDLFVEAGDAASFDQPRIALGDGGRRAVIEAPVVPGTLQGALTAAPVTLTLVDGDRAMEATATPVEAIGAPMVAEPEASAGWAALGGMLGIALLGGLILNLMPCVLPVLSIKVVGAIGHGGAERGHVRAAFLASAAGIVASFLALAAAALAVKAAGAAVGWGIQFQQPAFLAVMVTILALFAANMWGLFEVPLPAFLTGAGPGGTHHSLFGHFLSGAFATLLATPCSAPFLGTAVGFALSRGPTEIVVIFAALGTGMATPYLLMAAWPAGAQMLPKPGPWMIRLRQILGLALAGTGLWLLTILATQSGPIAALVVGGAMAAAIGVLAARRRLPKQARSASGVAVAALAVLAIAAPFQAGFSEQSTEDAAPTSGPAWQRFDAGTIPKLVAEGKVVFVDVTADWCITCKVNKAAVLDRGPVSMRLSQAGIVAMRADWTRPDNSIARYLASFGRYGIPFNAVYGPAAPQGIALPELLTEAEVMAAIDKAAGKAVAAR